jgi:hypothetical protein
VIDLHAFDLDQALTRKPEFLEPEYPFEWTGVYRLEPGLYSLVLDQGPDPAMSIVALPLPNHAEETLREGAERCVRLYAEPALALQSPGILGVSRHCALQLASPVASLYRLDISAPTLLGLYTEHLAEEFNLRLLDGDLSPVVPVADHTWVAAHEHDDEVGSVGIELDGDVDPDRLERWLSLLLRERGIDIFRMKGFISVADDPMRFVFQGVHMLFDGQPDRPWGDEPRRSQLVFIGRNLDAAELHAGFRACLV